MGVTVKPAGETTVTLTRWLKPFRLVTDRVILTLDPATRLAWLEDAERAKS